MKPAEIRALQDRWRTPGGRELTKRVARWLAGATRRPAEILDVDGRADLRGFEFPDARAVRNFRKRAFLRRGTAYQSVSGMPEFTGIEWRSLDLSAAVLRLARFKHATIVDCVLDSADLLDWRLWGSTVLDTSFVGADLDGALFGHEQFKGWPNRWERVDFDRANLQGASFTYGLLHNATFRGAKIRLTTFNYLDFKAVTFEGVLHDAQFVALPPPGGAYHDYWMRDVDFEGAQFRNGMLQGYRTENVRLPPDVLLVSDFPTVHARAVQRARETGDSALSLQLDRESRLLRGDSKDQAWAFALFMGDFIGQPVEEAGLRLHDAYESAQRELLGARKAAE